MTTWVLIIYMSVGFSNMATGGPTSIDGFTSEEKCLVAAKTAEKLPKFDWAHCLKVSK